MRRRAVRFVRDCLVGPRGAAATRFGSFAVRPLITENMILLKVAYLLTLRVERSIITVQTMMNDVV